MKYAYIFDFDGVLVNTMDAHFVCYKQALEEVGVSIDRKQFYYQAGMTGLEQIQYFADEAGVTVDAKEVYVRKREIWASAKPVIGKIECNLQLLKTLKDAGHRVAIATGSSIKSVGPIIEEFNIDVDAVATADDVERGKPNPDLFLHAAEKLGVPPEQCVVVEDSDVGIEAALAAGMKAMRFFENSEEEK